MLSMALLVVAIACGSVLATPASSCTAKQRLHYVSQIPYAYSQDIPGATYAAFHAIPFGAPNLDSTCATTIYANGDTDGISVTKTGNGVVRFGATTRQLFSSVTGQYVDFGHNGTSVIYTNVTLGVRSDVPVPVTFSGQVYVDFTSKCRISAVRAYAEIPTYINGQATNIYKLLDIPSIPV